MADILAIGLNAKPKTRSVSVCLDGEIDQALADLGQRLVTAQEEDKQAFAGAGKARKVLDQIEKLKAKAAESAVTFHMRRLPPLRVLEIQVEHPPREDDRSDENQGWNRETYYPALVRECTYEVSHADGTKVAVADLTDEWWKSVLGAVNLKQFNELYSTALEVNQGDAAAPFVQAALQPSTSKGGVSKQRSSGASARSGSKAGSRAKKSPSSTGSKTEPPADG